MRRLFMILALIGFALGSSVAVSVPAGAAIRANDDDFLFQKLGNRLRVVLNDQVLFKKIKITHLGSGKFGWRFKVDAKKFFANDVGNNKAIVAFSTLSRISGIDLSVVSRPNGVVKRVLFTVRAKVFNNPGRRLLTDYVLRANDPQYDAGLVFVRIVSPS
jgi:hypothetical protein